MRCTVIILTLIFVSCQQNFQENDFVGKWEIENFDVKNNGIEVLGLALLFEKSQPSVVEFTANEISFSTKQNEIIENYEGKIVEEENAFFFKLKNDTEMELSFSTENKLTIIGEEYSFDLKRIE